VRPWRQTSVAVAQAHSPTVFSAISQQKSITSICARCYIKLVITLTLPLALTLFIGQATVRAQTMKTLFKNLTSSLFGETGITWCNKLGQLTKTNSNSNDNIM